MKPKLFLRLKQPGGLSLLAGVIVTACFLLMAGLPSLRGPQVIPFLGAFGVAGAAYLLAAVRLKKDNLPLMTLWGFAILFRLILLSTSPTLSDDAYRYLWDGNLLNRGVSPYAQPVNSPVLDPYHIPAREMVNHNWMASPYLPFAQVYFGLIARIAPGSLKAFQVAAVFLDLGTGWLMMAILRWLRIPRRASLIYLWNPLVVIESAHGAHVDTLMVFFMILGLYFLVKPHTGDRSRGISYRSALSLAAATLTKGLPGLLAPLFLRRWGWRGSLLFGSSLVAALFIFAIGAGWGLSGPLDGRGLFGALRIYQSYWNYNSGLYHWLEVWLSGYPTVGAVPPEVIGLRNLNLLRGVLTAITAAISLAVGGLAWRRAAPDSHEPSIRKRTLLRLAAIPLGAFLLLSHTLHPWYVTVVLPLLPFLVNAPGENSLAERFLWPWIYFSLAIGLSYLSYIDPNNPREFAIVRWVEYIPFYGLLLWAARPPLRQIKKAPHGGR